VVPNSFIDLRKTKKKKRLSERNEEISDYALVKRNISCRWRKLGCAANKPDNMPTELSWLQTEQKTNINVTYK
jgi:hypothetical protein